MAIFDKIKKAKKAAEKHKRESIQPTTEAAPVKKEPYKHVPTHAAQDALAGTPASWTTEESMSKIKEQNKRRSAMGRTNSEAAMSMMSVGSARSSYSNRSSTNLHAAAYTQGGKQMSRSASDMSIDTLMRGTMQRNGSFHAIPYVHPNVPPMPPIPANLKNQRPKSYSQATKRSPLSEASSTNGDDSDGSEASGDTPKTASSGSSNRLEMKKTNEQRRDNPYSFKGAVEPETQAPKPKRSSAPQLLTQAQLASRSQMPTLAEDQPQEHSLVTQHMMPEEYTDAPQFNATQQHRQPSAAENYQAQLHRQQYEQASHMEPDYHPVQREQPYMTRQQQPIQQQPIFRQSPAVQENPPKAQYFQHAQNPANNAPTSSSQPPLKKKRMSLPFFGKKTAAPVMAH